MIGYLSQWRFALCVIWLAVSISVAATGRAAGLTSDVVDERHDAAASPTNISDVWAAEGNVHAGIKMLRTIEGLANASNVLFSGSIFESLRYSREPPRFRRCPKESCWP